MLDSFLNKEGISALNKQQPQIRTGRGTCSPASKDSRLVTVQGRCSKPLVYKSLLILIFFPLMAFSQFTVEGKIMDLKNIENLNIYLSVGMDVNKTFPATIKNDNFHITGELEEPINSMLVINNAGKRRSIKLLLDSESTYEVDIVLENNHDYFEENWYRIKTNSDYHNVWREFYDIQAELVAKKRMVNEEFEERKINKRELDKRISKLNMEINQKFKDLAIARPPNYAVAYILNGAPDLSMDYLKYYETLEKDVQESYWGQKLKEILDKMADEEYQYTEAQPVLGSKMQMIKGRSIDGENKMLLGENMGAKLTLVDFWASWCAPCRTENIQLGLLNSNYNKEEFTIISFSLDNNLENWRKASIKDNISWENISDLNGTRSKTMKDFQIKELPRNILVNSDGEIIAVDKFGSDLEEFVKDYLGS